MLMVIAAGLGVPASPQAAPSTAAGPPFETCASLSSLYASAGKPEYKVRCPQDLPAAPVSDGPAKRTGHRAWLPSIGGTARPAYPWAQQTCHSYFFSPLWPRPIILDVP